MNKIVRYFLTTCWLSIVALNSVFAQVPCGIPTGITVSEMTANSATISWITVPGATSYILDVDDVSDTGLDLELSVTGNSHIVNGLITGVNYDMEVTAVCGTTVGIDSPPIFFTHTPAVVDNNPTTPTTPTGNGGVTPTGCGIPNGITFTNSTATSTMVTWNAVAGATSYILDVKDANNNGLDIELSITGNSHVVNGLTAGVNYEVEVTAVCGTLVGIDSPTFLFTQGNNEGIIIDNNNNNGGNNDNETAACGIPTGLTISEMTDNSVRLSWNRVPGAIRYEIDVDGAGAANENFEFDHDFIFETSRVVYGLVPGLAYEFDVNAVCAVGESFDSPDLIFTHGPNGGVIGIDNNDGNGNNDNETAACGIPTGLTVSEMTDNSVKVSWNPVPGALRYEVDIDGAENANENFEFDHDFIFETSRVVYGLVPGLAYEFDVNAVCAVGESFDSPDLIFTQGPNGGVIGVDNNGNGNNDNETAACGIPTGLTVSEMTNNSARVSWNPVPGAIRYEVDVDAGNGNNTGFEFDHDFIFETSRVVYGLVPGLVYEFEVNAVCAVGESFDSPDLIFTHGTPGGILDNGNNNGGNVNAACGTPTNLSISNVTDISARMNWNLVPGATRYEIEVEAGAGNLTGFRFKNEWNFETFRDVYGLRPGENYTFKVNAVCGNIEGFDSPDFPFNYAGSRDANRWTGAFWAESTLEETVEVNLGEVATSNHYAYLIEKSIDGNDFELMKQYGSQVNGLEKFQTVDDNPVEGDNYYRAKVIFYNGDYIYTPIQKVTFGKLPSFSVFPNPTQEVVTLNLKEWIGQEKVDITIHNSVGVEVQNQKIQQINTPLHNLNVSTLQDGLYLVSMKIGNRKAVAHRLMISRL